MIKPILLLFVWLTFLGAAPGEVLIVTNLDDDGDGSLRAQIDAANSDPGLSEIIFADSLSGVIQLASTLSVTSPLRIRAGSLGRITLDGGDATRVLSMRGSSLAEPHVLEGLTIQNGSSTLGGANVRVFGSLQLLECVVRGGRSVAINGSGNNSQNADGGGLFHSGGNLLISDSLFSENEAVGGFSQGGGFYTENGTANLLRSRIVANTTNGFVGEGGGLGSRSVMVIDDCEISGNETIGPSSGGGGIYTDTTITIRQTTLSQNVVGAETGEEGYSVGGAFANVGNGNATFISCTITQNSAPPGKGQGGGISSLSRGVLSFRNCIVAGNFGDDLDETPNGSLRYRDDGENLFGVVTNTNLAQAANQNPSSQYQIEDPDLSELGFFGGTTRVHLPLDGSPAIDRGSVSGAGFPQIDQRGADFPRLVGERLDIGAAEQQRFIDTNNNSVPDAVELIIEGFETSDGDFDGDGFGDALEYTFLGIAAIADPSRSPATNIQRAPDSSSFNITFPTSPNREYRLLSTPDLRESFTPITEAFSRFSSLQQGTFSEITTAPRSFYQVQAQIPLVPE